MGWIPALAQVLVQDRALVQEQEQERGLETALVQEQERGLVQEQVAAEVQP